MKFSFFGASRLRQARVAPNPKEKPKDTKPQGQAKALTQSSKSARPSGAPTQSPFAESLKNLQKGYAPQTQQRLHKPGPATTLQSARKSAKLVSTELNKLLNQPGTRTPEQERRIGKLIKKSEELASQVKTLEQQVKPRAAAKPSALESAKSNAKIVSSELNKLLEKPGPKTPGEERRIGRLLNKSQEISAQIKTLEARSSKAASPSAPAGSPPSSKAQQTAGTYGQSKPSSAQFAALEKGKVWDDMPRDGNCLFHAISAAKPEYNGHDTIRAIVAAAVGEFSSDEIESIQPGANKADLERQFAKSGNFQIDNMVGAAAKVLGLNINVVTRSGETVAFRQNEDKGEPDLVVALANRHYFLQVPSAEARNPVPD